MCRTAQWCDSADGGRIATPIVPIFLSSKSGGQRAQYNNQTSRAGGEHMNAVPKPQNDQDGALSITLRYLPFFQKNRDGSFPNFRDFFTNRGLRMYRALVGLTRADACQQIVHPGTLSGYLIFHEGAQGFRAGHPPGTLCSARFSGEQSSCVPAAVHR